MTEDELRKNIREQRESLGLSAAEMAEKIGVNGQTIYDIESGKVRLKVGVLLKIKEVFPNLKTGFEPVDFVVGNVINKMTKLNLPKQVSQEKLLPQNYKIDGDVIQIPEYDIILSAGHGSYPDDHALSLGFRPFSLRWIKKKGLNPTKLSLVRVSGDSMEPLLKDKDIVMIDQSRTTPKEAMPYAIRFGEDLLVKTIQRQGDGNIALVSKNKEYDNIIISKNNPPEEFQIIGAVVWHAHSWV